MTTRMPAAFIGHGNPMQAVRPNRYTEAWADFGRSVPPPRAILVISAHWYTNATAVTGMVRPRTIHDFYGFPQELYDVTYPAPGLPELAEEVADLAKPTWVGCDIDSWGIDHGTWMVLRHAFPDASIPVVQLSLNAFESWDYHLELGRKLGELRDHGVLVIGSGNVVHNLGAVDQSRPDEGFAWARRFDEAARGVLQSAPPPTWRRWTATPTSPTRCRPPTTTCRCSTSPVSPATSRCPSSSTATRADRCPWRPTPSATKGS